MILMLCLQQEWSDCDGRCDSAYDILFNGKIDKIAKYISCEHSKIVIAYK